MPALRPVPAAAGAPAAPGVLSRAAAPPPLARVVALDTLVAPDGTFSGYASLFDTPDMGNDVIAPGAFSASLARRGPRGIKLLFHHDPREPIGVWRTLREDARGLYAQGQLTLDNSKARDILALLRSGAIDGLSIGFRAVQASRPTKGIPRRLTAIDLWEISIVTFPMLPGARVDAVKTDRPRARSPTPATPRANALATLTAAIRANT